MDASATSHSAHSGRVPTGQHDSPPLKLTPVAALSFLCGALHLLKLNFVGELYGTEVALLLLAIVARPSSRGDNPMKSPQFRWFLVLGVLSLAGYMISDLVRGSTPEQYMRGWARITFVITDFVAMSMMIANDRRNLWWFVLGLAMGSIAYLKLIDHASLRDMRAWKFGYCVPVVLGICCVSVALPLRVSSALLVGIGVYSIWWDARIYGGICFFIATMLWVRASPRMRGSRLLARLLIVGAIATVALGLSLSRTHDDFEQRRDASNFGRAVAFRAGLNAIFESPVIGWGSWSKGPELLSIAREAIKDEKESSGRAFYAEERNYVSPHSQILQAWVEGGILGAAFFLFLGKQMLGSLRWTALSRRIDRYTPIILFYFSAQLWHLVESPLGQTQRIHVALAAAITVMVYAERRNAGSPGQMMPATHKAEVKLA